MAGGFLRFLLRGRVREHEEHATYPWYVVLWLTGVDYFSTLGYQPGIAFLAAGALSPLSTGILVLVTMVAAAPVYAEVAGRSYMGQGSIAMLERLLRGWFGKVFVLALLGFGATDFVITMTLSAADAAKHALENPFLHPLLGEHQVGTTLALLLLLAIVFLAGFREAIGLAILVGAPYMLLSATVVARGVWEILQRPETWNNWKAALALRGDWTAIAWASLLIFPKLALGLSGFETGVSVMPLVRGEESGREPKPPRLRIAHTRRLLFAAASLMSLLLVGSSVVTTLLIPAPEFAAGGKANGRALAYLAHELLGHWFGTAYDFITIAILWFAGASAMAALLNLMPRYLPRFGMAPRWVEYPRPLVLVFLAINTVVTLVFRADVDAQAGAYATGVLVLILSAAVAVTLALWPENRLRSLYFTLVTGVFAFALVDNVIERPDGVIIASCFIAAILTLSGVSRYQRAFELRVERLEYAGEASERLWKEITGKRVNLVPIKHPSHSERSDKRSEIRQHYRLDKPLAFLHVELRDDRSEFEAPLRVKVEHLPGRGDYVIVVSGAVAIANTIAYVSERLDPVSIFLELTRRNPVTQALRYLLWGEGETGIMVYEILVRHWERTPGEDVRPLIFLRSD
jgi:hypothetical protein